MPARPDTDRLATAATERGSAPRSALPRPLAARRTRLSDAREGMTRVYRTRSAGLVADYALPS